jgi:hypothetical protein
VQYRTDIIGPIAPAPPRVRAPVVSLLRVLSVVQCPRVFTVVRRLEKCGSRGPRCAAVSCDVACTTTAVGRCAHACMPACLCGSHRPRRSPAVIVAPQGASEYRWIRVGIDGSRTETDKGGIRSSTPFPAVSACRGAVGRATPLTAVLRCAALCSERRMMTWSH